MAEREDPEERAGNWRGIVTGLVAAAIVAWWTRPEMHPRGARLTLAAATGTVWLLAVAVAGTLGMALAGGFAGMRGQRRLRAGMNAAAVWVLIPPLLLLIVVPSPWFLLLVAAAAAGLALCLWALAPRNFPGDDDEASGWRERGPTFAELPSSKSGAKQSAAIAVCLELALLCGLRGDLFWAELWLASGFLLLTWKTLASLARPGKRSVDTRARSGGAATAALVLILMLLTMGFVRGRPAGGGGPASASAQKEGKKPGAAVDDAYRGIVLFTVTDKKKELPPLPVERSLLRTGASRPVVIPFNGSYWYFQAPQHGPGLHPHLAHGDPVSMNIYSTGWVPLAMQAHQSLPQPIPVRGGEQLELTLRNGDNREGRIEVAVLLTDSRGPGLLPSEKPSQVLGVKPMLSSEPPEFALKASPVEEDMKFAIPLHTALRQFDTITVLFFPSEVRDTSGARVGIRQFELLPR